ncbi:hypothetical protein BJ508DRAFT_359028 [Ascobolus immersus RN42]|uniref:Uncharacterized protein n=1 Tax=Ascobolus immersus RN42 TaxID=1160509 RepID=A0A3N4IGL9_ASCIM|nr:hypothetical protein BJ508DRAFT_359028 [Ascobolus immersus RN42]
MALQSSSRILASLAGKRLFTTASAPMARFREDNKPYGGSEETQSGTNAEIAADDEAFDPSKTNPQAEKDAAQQKPKDGNPLQYSGANPEVSDPKETKGRREGGGERERPSVMKQKKTTTDPDSGEKRGQYSS